jgi:hypothetical protein
VNNLSERENKFVQMLYDHTGGDVSQIVVDQDLYPLADRTGFNKHEVTSITLMLRGLGLLEKRQVKGEIDGEQALMIACVKLTSKGALYVRSLSETVIQDLSGGNEKKSKSAVWEQKTTPDANTAVPSVSTHIVERIRESKWTKAGVVITIILFVVGILLQYFKVFS